MSYLLLLYDGQQVVPHQVDLLPPLTQPLNFFQAPRGVVDLPVLSENRGFSHHLLNVLIDCQDSIEYLPGSLGTEASLVLYGILILFGFLFCLLKPPFNPR
jgi:hypothetical protein